jgi:diguanylate cyclase (GGDEF)-like protein/PAS domain S-box-containing protein
VWYAIIGACAVLGMLITLWTSFYMVEKAQEKWVSEVDSFSEDTANNIKFDLLTLNRDLSHFLMLYNGEHPKQSAIEASAKSLIAKYAPLKRISVFTSITGASNTQNTVSLFKSDSIDLSSYATPILSQHMLDGMNGSLNIHRSPNESLLTFYKPIVGESKVAWILVGQIDLKEFIRKHHVTSGIIGSTDLKVSLTNESGGKLWNSNVLTLSEIPKIYHESRQSFNFDSQKLTLDWKFKPDALSGMDFFTAGVIGLIGFIITLALCGILWGQLRMQSKVSREVVLRTKELEDLTARFKTISDNAYDLIALVSKEHNFDYINLAYTKLLGYQSPELKGKSVLEFIHENDKESVENHLISHPSNTYKKDITFRLKKKDGSFLHVETVIKDLILEEDDEPMLVMHCRDVTARKQYADQLARSEQRFRDFAESSSDWLWEIDADGLFNYVSPGVKETLGYTSNEMIGAFTFDRLFNANNDTTRALIESRIERHQPYRDIEFWTRSKSGDQICLRMSGVPVFDERQNFIGYRGAASNTTSSKLDRQNMFRLATTDSLTNLLNRTRFMEELDRTLGLAKRHKTSGVLLFIDLDRFKEVNDTHGHEAGDALLKSVADVLERNVRTTDVVARLGGDEFGVIMHNIDTDRAREKVDKIIEDINALRIDFKGIKLQATMSIGVVTYPQEDRDTASLIMSADLAMYRAKDMGRNRAYIDDQGDTDDGRDSIREQLKWVERLRKALQDGDFEMHYQPLVPSHKTQRPLFEALIRLRDENGDLGAPGIFIDAAEHFGLIQELDLAVVNRCFEQQLQLKKEGFEYDVSINLSGRSIGDQAMIETLKENLNNHEDLNPANFIFEVTETAALHDPAAYRDIGQIREFMNELHDMGFRFALDDFGTGFSSFTYIKQLKIDVLKIDGSFVRQITTSKNDQLFVRSISDLAKGMGIKTVAEFVEDEKILAKLDELGIDYVQGYYLSRPEADLKSLHERFKGKNYHDFLLNS